MVDDEEIKGPEREGADQSRREERGVYRSCNICDVLGARIANAAERDVDWEGGKEGPGIDFGPLLIDGRDLSCSLDGPTGTERPETPGASSPALALGSLPSPSPGRLAYFGNGT